MAWKKKNGSECSPSGAWPCNEHGRDKVPRGHVPMITCGGERVVVPVRLLAAPSIAKLLDMAAQ
jgi:hypothetical protein